MKQIKYYLAIDIGASSGRHILGWLENGKIRIPIETLIELASFMIVDMNYITAISNVKNKFPK